MVVVRMVATRASLKGASRWAKLTRGSFGTSGSAAATLRKHSAPSTVTNHIVARQLAYDPINDPSGAPNATAMVVPPKTTANARPRCSGGAKVTATAVAAEKYAAAPTAATTRLASTQPKVGATAVSK